MQNRFEKFSQNIIAMHTGSAGAFDPARMMFPSEEKERSSQETQNLYMTNVYRIQNLTEENYLYRQNFQFLTQMFEKQIHRKLYPQVERQVEKTIRQELPKAEDRVIQEMTKELHTLVKESGVEQLRVLEKEAKEEQKVLLRKIENIYNSSVYVNVRAKNIRNDNVTISGRVENGQKQVSTSDRNTWLRTQITSVLERKEQDIQPETKRQVVRNLTEEILQKVQTKNVSTAIQQTERVYLEQVLEEYAEGKTDRQQTIQQATEIIERFARREQTERRVSEWNTAAQSASKPMKEKQSGKVRSTQLLKWMELAAEGKVPTQLTEQVRHVAVQSQMDAAPMEHLRMSEENMTAQASQHSASPATKAMESHVADEAIHQKIDIAPMEHLTTSEERVAQPSQAVQSQMSQSTVHSQSVRNQDAQNPQATAEQPQIWTAQSLQESQHSASPAVKAMESHLAEEAIRQRTEMAPMEHLTAPEGHAVQSSQAAQPQTLQSTAQSQSARNQIAQSQSLQAKSEQLQGGRSHDMSQPQVWTTQTLPSLQHKTSSVSPSVKAMENHPAPEEEAIRQRSDMTPMEYLTDQVQHTAEPTAIQSQQRTPQRFTPVQMLPQQSSDMAQAMPSTQIFPQMQQPPEVPQAATMRQSSRRQPMTMPHPQPYMMEAAPIIYAEEHKPATDPGETQVIRKQIREITEHIDEVKKTVAVERQVLTEQQKESIRQMIRSTPSLLTEGEMAVLMKQKVETEVSRKMDESMQQMTNRVYRRIEEKLKTERERRGRI